MAQHPYQASVPASEQKSPIQQSVFPAWHDRRLTKSSDLILGEGKRVRGTFELLQGLVNEKQREEDERQEKERIRRASETSPPLKISTSSLNMHDNGIVSSLPSILNQQSTTPEKAEAKPEEAKAATTTAASVRRSQSVRFNVEQQQQQQFMHRSRSVRFTEDEKKPIVSRHT